MKRTIRRSLGMTALVFLLAVPLVPAGKPKAEPAPAAPAIPSAQVAEAPDLVFMTRLRDEEFRHGQVMDIMAHLTDDIGPRLTGSPNMKKANDWTRDQFAQWGLANAHLEPWGSFGRGWAYQFCSVRMTAPDAMQFLALPEAWTPGTGGAVSGPPVHVLASRPEDLEKYRGKLAGKIVLLGDIRLPDPEIHEASPDERYRRPQNPNSAPLSEPFFRRYSDSDLDKIAAYSVPSAAVDEYRAMAMQRWKFRDALQKFLNDEHPLAVLEPSRSPGQDGTIAVQSGGPYEKAKAPMTVPIVTVALEHFNRAARLVDKNIPVEIEVNVQAQFYDQDDKGYNTVAEIPGTDPRLKDQVVMLGGHMDSWHAGEGATDNGAGVAAAMEAVRLLQHLGVKPRRTIRIALWSGEEQGIYGSDGYVRQHFGSRPEPSDPEQKNLPDYLRKPTYPLTLKPEQAFVSAYFNVDNGTGRIRGVYLQENAAVAPIFQKWMEPFRDLGMTTLTMRNTSGTDHLSFDAVGIPGFQFIQDPMDYDELTHHTNLDVYEHIRPDDMKQVAVVLAGFVYDAAMRDDMLPRKPIRPEELLPRGESESGAEKKGEPAPAPSNPVNPAKPLPQPQAQPH